MRERGDELVLAPVGLVQRLLHLLALVQVADHRHPALAGGREAHARPALADRGVLDLALVAHVLAGQHALDVRAHARVGLCAEYFGHAAAVHLALRDAEPVVVGAVAEAIALLAVEVGDERRDIVRHQAQALFALAQRRLGGCGALHRAARHEHGERQQRGRARYQRVEHYALRPGRFAGQPGAQLRRHLQAGGDDDQQRAGDDQHRTERQEGASQDHAIRQLKDYLDTAPRLPQRVSAARPD